MDEVSQGDPQSATLGRVDGRHQRSARTRLAIIEAYLALLRKKPRIPTAEQVARQAKLSARAVFAHFADLQALGVAAFDHILSPGLSTPAGDKVNADRQSRIRFQVEVRARNSENWLPLWRVVERGNLRSPEISHRTEIVRQLVRARINLMYERELATLSKADRLATVAAIESLTDFESWGRLREHYELSHEDACAAWTKMIDRLLPPTP